MKHLPLLAVIVGALVGCSQPAAPPATRTSGGTTPAEMPTRAPAPTAEAMLRDAQGNALGTVTFTQQGKDVEVHVTVHDVPGAGMHGIHIHEAGQCVAPDFASAGGHFAPDGNPHGCPPTVERHAGDLGNIDVAEDGSGTLSQVTDRLSLGAGPTSVIGRTVILHQGQDDCTSQPSGNSGARIACGQIIMPTGSAPPKPSTPASSPNNPQS